MDSAEVIPLPRKPPHPGDLTKLVRRLAEEGAVAFDPHAFDERGPNRRIDIGDMRRILKRGMIKGAIVAGHHAGEWRCKFVDRAENSSRWLGVVVVVIRDRRLYVITAEWEDS